MPDVTHTKNGIPKLFHYIWIRNERVPISGVDGLPEKFYNYMKGWKEKHPDYEFMYWDNKRIKQEDELMDRLNELKKNLPLDPVNTNLIHPDLMCAGFSYAVITDYIRYYIMSKYGGIYIDTDMWCVRSSEPNIELAEENQIWFAGEPGNSWCKRLNYYRVNNNFMVCKNNNPIMKTILDESHIRLLDILKTELPTEHVMSYRDYTCPDLSYGDKLRAVAFWIGPRWIDMHILDRKDVADNIKIFAFWQYGMSQKGSILKYKDRSWDLTFAYHDTNSLAEWDSGRHRNTNWEWPFI